MWVLVRISTHCPLVLEATQSRPPRRPTQGAWAPILWSSSHCHLPQGHSRPASPGCPPGDRARLQGGWLCSCPPSMCPETYRREQQRPLEGTDRGAGEDSSRAPWPGWEPGVSGSAEAAGGRPEGGCQLSLRHSDLGIGGEGNSCEAAVKDSVMSAKVPAWGRGRPAAPGGWRGHEASGAPLSSGPQTGWLPGVCRVMGLRSLLGGVPSPPPGSSPSRNQTSRMGGDGMKGWGMPPRLG